METIEEYWQAITILEAQEQLVAATTLSVPHMKKGAHSKWKREMHRLAYPNKQERRALTLKELAESGAT